MTATIHRLLITVSSLFGGLGGLWSLTEVEPLGIPPEVGAVCAMIAFVTNIGANAVRANWPMKL